jgi:hypothetical protein
MTPFPGNVLQSGQQFSVDHDASTDTCSHDDPKDTGCILPGAIDRFSERKTVGIILKSHGSRQKCLKVLEQRPTNETLGIRVFYPAGIIQCTRGRDPN